MIIIIIVISDAMQKAMKCQSAMEYLMTYGWAILIITIALASLFFLGFFNPSNFVSTFCLGQGGFKCQNPVLATNGNLAISITNNVGQSTSNASFYISTENSGFNSKGFPTIAYKCIPFNIYLHSGQEINLLCNIPPLSNSKIGTLFEGSIWMNFSQSSSSPAKFTEEIGKLAVKTSAVVIPLSS